MIEEGTKLRLIKPIGGLKNIGEEFIISEVNDDMIYFYSKSGDGCISTDEWNMYFEEINSYTKKWGDWYTEETKFELNGKSRKIYVRVRLCDYGIQVKYKGIKTKILVENPGDYCYDTIFEEACQKLFIKYLKNNNPFSLGEYTKFE